MKTKNKALVILPLFLMAFVGCSTAPKTVTSWEYRTETGHGPYTLGGQLSDGKKIGAYGWELVSVVPYSVGGSSDTVVFYYKRPLLPGSK